MPVSRGFETHLRDICGDLEGIAFRRMFGGLGIYLDGLMVGLAAGDVLYLKCDEQSARAFDAEGLEPFVYAGRGGRPVTLSFRRAPERVFEDPQALATWMGYARRAAARAARQRRRRAPVPR